MNTIYLSGDMGDVPHMQAAGGIPIVTAYAIDSHCTLLRTCRTLPIRSALLTLTDRFAGNLACLSDPARVSRLCRQIATECHQRGFQGVFFNSHSFACSSALLQAVEQASISPAFFICRAEEQLSPSCIPVLHTDAAAPFTPQLQQFLQKEHQTRAALLSVGAFRYHLPQLEEAPAPLSLTEALAMRGQSRATLFFDPLRQQGYFTRRTSNGAESIHLDSCESLVSRAKLLAAQNIHTFFLSWRPLCALCSDQNCSPRELIHQLSEAGQ